MTVEIPYGIFSGNFKDGEWTFVLVRTYTKKRKCPCSCPKCNLKDYCPVFQNRLLEGTT